MIFTLEFERQRRKKLLAVGETRRAGKYEVRRCGELPKEGAGGPKELEQRDEIEQRSKGSKSGAAEEQKTRQSVEGSGSLVNYTRHGRLRGSVAEEVNYVRRGGLSNLSQRQRKGCGLGPNPGIAKKK